MSRGMRIVALMGVFLIVGLLFRDAVNNASPTSYVAPETSEGEHSVGNIQNVQNVQNTGKSTSFANEESSG
jgi:hypothetical protein